jgi:hypothetical protein
MAYIKADTPKEQEHFDYLEELRQSGDTNMFGAGQYLQAAFGLSKDKARTTLSRWMKFHDDPARKLEGPASKTKTKVRISTVAEVEREAR